jgi:hypothetical protein
LVEEQKLKIIHPSFRLKNSWIYKIKSFTLRFKVLSILSFQNRNEL